MQEERVHELLLKVSVARRFIVGDFFFLYALAPHTFVSLTSTASPKVGTATLVRRGERGGHDVPGCRCGFVPTVPPTAETYGCGHLSFGQTFRDY